jgi:hypothetical protein
MISVSVRGAASAEPELSECSGEIDLFMIQVLDTGDEKVLAGLWKFKMTLEISNNFQKD